ncbi:hypothetical protein [Bradyrhizobium roseum]|uniref:hypothetical protein n=1 Tax=Bradyrhizobium roseum TaxID=3056648 RepID=UPI002629FC94|nr:hypothetical protein [Bradyrhizobium roseus]WKA31578.1 hypothetical protein QUH67_16085 [Bradyrhizobium roseus]
MSRAPKKAAAAAPAQQHAPRFLLICDLMGIGARILEEAAILRGGDLHGAEASIDGLRRAVASAAKSFAAYDAAIDADKAAISHVEWQMLCNGDRRVVALTIKDFDGAIEVHT